MVRSVTLGGQSQQIGLVEREFDELILCGHMHGTVRERVHDEKRRDILDLPWLLLRRAKN